MSKARKLRWGSAGLVFGMALFGGGLAMASVPDGNTVHACRKAPGGALRVIDTAANQSCQAGETPLNWSTWNFRGAWSQTTAYKKGDVVTFMGSSLVATADIPVGGADTWAVVAQAGAKGKTGPAGPAGPSGTSAVYEARCTDCHEDTAHDADIYVTVVNVSVPAGHYFVTAHATPFNQQVIEGVRVYCDIKNGGKSFDESEMSIDSTGLASASVEAEVSVQASGSFSGTISLVCIGDGSWHVRQSVISAVAVDKVTATGKP